MKMLLTLTLALCALLLAGELFTDNAVARPAALPNTPALLAIPTDLVAAGGYSVTVPVVFQSGGNAVGSTTFSLDFDESCLAFDDRDGNNDGRPDTVRFGAPLAFRSSASYNATDLDGELDVVIADYSLPIASLPDLPELMTVRFTALCAPAAGEHIMAPVRFSTAPVASFGDVNGLDVESSVSHGVVVIYNEVDLTPTTTPVVTPDPGTPTPVVVTSTPSAALAPGTPTVTPTLVPTTVPGTPTPIPANHLYLPVINR